MRLGALIFIVAIQALSLLAVIYSIGRPRKPITPAVATLTLVIAAIEVLAAVVLYRS